MEHTPHPSLATAATTAAAPGPQAVTDGASSRLARNTSLTLLSQVPPAVAAIVCIPLLVAALGIERFGVFSLAIALVGYMTYLDLGLGRATTRAVADVLGRGQPELMPRVLWTSLTVQVAMGIAAGAGLAAAAPFLVGRLAHLSPPVAAETQVVLRLLAIGLPILIAGLSLRGALEAQQRFGLVSAIRAVSGSALFIAPVLAVALHQSLPGAVAGVVGTVAATGIAYLAANLAVRAELRSHLRLDASVLGPLFRFGGWVTVAGILIPLLVYSDRVLLAGISSLAAVAFYTVPYDLASRLQVLPGSLGTVLFPMLAREAATKSPAKAQLHLDSQRALLLIMGPIAIVVIVLGHEGMKLWLGSDFAARSTIVLQLITAGMVINALAQVSAQVIDSLGRPDLRAAVFAGMLLPYLAVLTVLIMSYSTTGAALGWTLRAVCELIVLFAVASRLLGVHNHLWPPGWFHKAALVLTLFSLCGIALDLQPDGHQRLLLDAVVLLLFGAVYLRLLVEPRDRALLRQLFQRVSLGWPRMVTTQR